MRLQSIDPATGELIESFDEISDSGLEAALTRAQQCFGTYRGTSFADRADWLRKAAQILAGEKDNWAALMTREMGKTYQAAIAEAEKCAWVCRYFAEKGEAFLANEAIATGADRSYVRYLPLGPILAVMPWNFPFWQVIRFAAPTLMAGNVALLKHASNVSRCALALEEIFRRAGFPAGAFQTLLLGSSRVARLIADERVKAVTLTGSGVAGSKVAEEAGRVHQEDCPGARRLRCLHRPAERRRGRRREDGDHRAQYQQRAVVQRGQALHRARAGVRRLRAAHGGGSRPTQGRRSHAQ